MSGGWKRNTCPMLVLKAEIRTSQKLVIKVGLTWPGSLSDGLQNSCSVSDRPGEHSVNHVGVGRCYCKSSCELLLVFDSS